MTPTSTEELKNFFELSAPKPLHEIDYTKLRYAIYARKSTTGDERQERSIPDQIRDCQEKVVQVHGLKVIGDPITEKCSAKEPDIRPKFRQIIDDIKAGRIDGIISWHPDRLSRNMKEAGEIIDLLDKGILRDLRFATSSFENSPTGKMLLGISFVLSKQYSEHLGESVTRGNTNKTHDGKFFGRMKHGYTVNSQGQLFPDGNNFALIQRAFEMRLSGESQQTISEYLNQSSYFVHKNTNIGDKENRRYEYVHQPYKWDKDSVSKLLKDPVYAGVLKYGDALCNLEEYYDFTPAISVDEFFKINKITDFNSAKLTSSITANKKREVTKANLLRQIVFCGYCDKPFSSGLTSKVLAADKETGKKTLYYNYKCETLGCSFRGKSVRAKQVVNFALDILDKYLFTTEDNYRHYAADARQHAIEQTKVLRSELMSITRNMGEAEKELNETKDLIRGNPDMARHYDLDEIMATKDRLVAKHKELSEQIQTVKEAVLTYEQYLELFSSLSSKLRSTHDISLIDQVLRKFFSNFTVKQSGSGKQQRCEIDYKLKEPWAGFLQTENFVLGRG